MKTNKPSEFSIYTGTDLAFALVVFISLFSAFSTSPVSSIFLIILIIFLSMAYLSIGIYGFSYIRKSKSQGLKLVYFFLLYLLGGLIIYFGRGASFSSLLLLPIIAHAVMVLDSDWALSVNFGVLITYGISVWSYSHNIQEIWRGLPIFFVGQVFIYIFAQMAITEQKARERLQVLADELSEANRQLSEYAEQVHKLAIVQERNRFAREIHDGLGHYLTTINMQLNAAAVLALKDPKKAVYMLENAQKMTAEALVDVRNSVFALRKDNIELEELPQRIQKLVDDQQSADRKVNFTVTGVPIQINDPQINLTLYRAAQETLSNAHKYSQATRVNLDLDYSSSGYIQFTAQDNGVGAETIDGGFGLIGIKERVRLLNGEVTIDNQPGQGFIVKIRIPVVS